MRIMNSAARCLAVARGLAAAAAAIALTASAAMGQAPGLGASIELVDPHAFRVCADPRNLPFSDQAGEGFENKIAELLASKLGRPVTYTYYPSAPGFVRNTLNAYRCDVAMADPVGDDLMQTTNPYYHTTYVLVYRAGSDIDGIKTLDDPKLKGHRVGVIAGTPPAFLLVRANLLASAKSYPRTVDTRYDAPSKNMIDDLVAGNIDAGLLWGPIAGYYALHASKKLVLVPLASTSTMPMDFRIALGVRHSDQNWKRTLNRLLMQNRDEINKILVSYGVPLLDEQGHPLAQ